MKPGSRVPDPIAEELIAIKKLLVFQLLTNGASQKQLAAVLGIDQSQVSRMFPGKVAGQRTKDKG